jgi:hypothetical protein
MFALLEELTDTMQGATLILSVVVVCMLKLRNHLRYGKIRDIAKDQTVKYKMLYDHIDNELNKPLSKRQSIDDFLYWIVREHNNIAAATADQVEQ